MVGLNGHQELPEFASLLPEEELEPDEEPEPPLDPLDPLDEPEFELVPLLAVGVEEAVLSVLVELEPDDELELELDVLLVCVARGTVAATASEPAIPVAATIAVIVAARALPCRTERSAPSASMGQLRQGKLSFRDP
ncbi:hypothetical protein KDK95_13600 [Actinospica sp. MGRD01-02]|uniref:Uncharacterized protein n=1 Tax=Actinospica acidithermotolerans TaxID=2828514 RepID=A0A941EBF5_9ACTN|nr:hypothetical protein [Actinospica acidithermotolerans]MBR7827347.1 hypothetical protein [Actinospica acidithermotolerans]